MTCLLIGPHGNDGSNGVLAKPCSNARKAVPLVSRNGGGSLTGAPRRLGNSHGVQQRFELRGLVTLTGRHFRNEGQAVAVSDQMEFCPESAARAAQSVVFWLFRPPFFPPPAAARLARMLLPSTHHKSQSMRPSVSSRICSASRRWSQVLSFLHRLNQSYTVCHGPNRSGRSRQGAPVRTIQRTPSTMIRKSLRGRPVAFGTGMKGSMVSHCSSVTPCRFMSSPSMALIDAYGGGIVSHGLPT